MPRLRLRRMLATTVLVTGAAVLSGCTDANTEDGNSGQDTPTAEPTSDD